LEIIGKVFFIDTKEGKLRGSRGEIHFTIYVAAAEWAEQENKADYVLSRIDDLVDVSDDLREVLAMMNKQIGIISSRKVYHKGKDKAEFLDERGKVFR